MNGLRRTKLDDVSGETVEAISELHRLIQSSDVLSASVENYISQQLCSVHDIIISLSTEIQDIVGRTGE